MLRIAAVLAYLLLSAPVHADTVDILAFGDSLTAGFGLSPDEAFPIRLEAALRAKGLDVRVINAGVSGDTATAAQARLDWALTEDVDAAVVVLGGNDALRGISPDKTQAALDAILSRLAEKNIPVLLAGMLAPRNLGADYAASFDAIYPALAQKHGAILYPFFLEGVAARPELNQPDGIHPNARGVDAIVAAILPLAETLAERTAR